MKKQSFSGLISIIIPVYNAAGTIKACIESCIHQTYYRIEIVVIDDGSTDESGRICEQFADGKRVKIIHQTNMGRTEARWKGVENAAGEWITFVDADDTLLPFAIEKMAEKADESCDIVFSNGRSIMSKPQESMDIKAFRHLTVLAQGTIGVPWGSLYRKGIVNRYQFDIARDIYVGEDYIFWLRLIFNTEKNINIVMENLYNKGIDHTSSTFVWTLDYAYRLNQLRMQAIPVHDLSLYLPDTITDRLANLSAITLHETRKNWQNHPFFTDILSDIKLSGYQISIKQRLFFNLPCQWLRRIYSRFSDFLH